jgi:hypothetical protein
MLRKLPKARHPEQHRVKRRMGACPAALSGTEQHARKWCLLSCHLVRQPSTAGGHRGSMVVLWHITVISTLLGLVAAQTCANYGTSNGTACACPPGYGGKDCSVPTCGGTIFEGASRKTVALQGSGDFGNITDCQCESGWAGEGCNVCQNANACSSAFASVSNGPATPPSVQDTGQNDTMTCNSGALVYAVSQMSCAVNVRPISVRASRC